MSQAIPEQNRQYSAFSQSRNRIESPVGIYREPETGDDFAAMLPTPFVQDSSKLPPEFRWGEPGTGGEVFADEASTYLPDSISLPPEMAERVLTGEGGGPPFDGLLDRKSELRTRLDSGELCIPEGVPPYDYEIKSWPQFFGPMISGQKLHDMRDKRDRDYKVGDRMLLREYDPFGTGYTGRVAIARITYITSNDTPCAMSSVGLGRDMAILSVVVSGPYPDDDRWA